MNETTRSNASKLAADAFNAAVERKKRRDADLASGEVEPSRAPELAHTVVKAIGPGQEERLLALLAMLSDFTLPALKEMTLGKIADVLTDAARAEGWQAVDIPFATPRRTQISWRDASDADREPFFDVLRRLFGRYIDGAERAAVETPGDDSMGSPVVDPSIKYCKVPPVVSTRLMFPFAFEGKAIRTIALNPPSYATVKAVAKGEISRTLMVAEMADLPIAAINALRWPDAERVVAMALDLAPQMEDA